MNVESQDSVNSITPSTKEKEEKKKKKISYTHKGKLRYFIRNGKGNQKRMAPVYKRGSDMPTRLDLT